MLTSTNLREKCTLITRVRRLIAIISFAIISCSSLIAQPNWVVPYPSTSNLTALNVLLNFQLDGPGTIYWVTFPYDTPPVLPVNIKAWWNLAPNPAFCGGGKISYTAGNVGSVISALQENLHPSTLTTIHIFVESLGGVAGPTQKLTITPPACANLNVPTSRFEPEECVNRGVTFILSMVGLDPDPQISGVYKGTTWNLIWGDGTPDMNYTSVSNNDYPITALRTHVYPSIANCVYTVTLNITSPDPCNKFFTVRYQVFVHGRDQATDGDGVLLIQENGTGVTTTIKVCEGNPHTITLKDMSTWNCQNPILGGLPFPPAINNSDRTIQWLYGIDNGGALQNTIGFTLGLFPPVVMGGVNNAIRTINGYAQPIITPAAYKGELSQTIDIPTSCRAGEYFNVYLRNWNKCNVYGIEPAIFTQIQILVVAAPAPPIAPDVTVCLGDPNTLTAAHGVPAGTVLSWYSNANKTGFLGNGFTYTPVGLPVGTYTYYVADKGSLAGNLCEGPVTAVNLTILPIIANNTIAAPQIICSGQTPAGLTGTLPTGGSGAYTYLWESSTVGAGGPFAGASGTNNTQNYTPPALAVTTWYRRTVSSGPCSNLSPVIQITVNPLPTITTAGTINSTCFNAAVQNATLPYTATTNAPTSYSIDWNAAANLAGLADQANTAFAFLAGGGNLNTIVITAGTPGGAYAGTMTIMNGNGCTKTQAVTLTVNPLPTITSVGTINTLCFSAAGQLATLPYTATTNAPTSYSIDWNAAANLAGLADQANTAFAFLAGGGNLTTIAITASTPAGAYSGTMTILNGNGCTKTQAVTLTINPLPTITTAGTINTLCFSAGAQTATLPYAATTNAPTSYSIDWNAAANAAGLADQANTAFGFLAGGGNLNTIAITAGTPGGAYSGNMTILNGNGCTNIQAVIITINPPPTITTTGTINPLCITIGGQTATLPYTATTNAPTSYSIDWNAAANAAGLADQANTAFGFLAGGGNLNTIAITAGTPAGVYAGTMTILNGCTNVQAVTLTINPLPTITTVGTINALCFSAGAQTATLPYSATTNAPTSYSIDWNAAANLAGLTDQANTAFAFLGGGGNLNTIAITAGTPAGAYSGTMTILNGNGCTNTKAVTIIINPLPTPVISGSNDVCANDPGVIYSTPPAGGRSYVWSISGGVITGGAGTNSITVTWGVAGAGWVKVTETIVATTCAVTTANYTVTINPGAPAGAPSLVSGATSICKDGTLNIDVTDVATANQYLWDYSWVAGPVNATTAVSQIAIDLTGVAPGVYTLTVAGANGCGAGPNMAPVHTFTIYANPVANAGPDQQICGSLVATLAAVPTVGIGTWTKTSGPGTVVFSNPNSSTSTATVSAYGSYVLRWTEVNGGICTSFDEVTVSYAEAANAGADQQKCGTLIATLTGNTPTVGSGTWTQVSGPGVVSFTPTANTPGATATATLYGTYVLRWTITNGGCNTTDDVTIAYAETANAGVDQQKCGTLIATLAGNAPSVGAGTWTKISGPGAVAFTPTVNTAAATATVTLYGTYVFRWTIVNGGCNTFDEVTVAYTEAANAGADQQKCGTLIATLTGNTPTVGSGTWTQVSGPGVVSFTPTANTPGATATATLYGTYVLRWTITNGGCNTSDDVTIAYAEAANAGVDQALCSTLVATLAGNAPLAGAGTWTKISGPGAVVFTPTINTAGATATVTLYGTYVFRWTIVNGGCNTFDEVTVAYEKTANAGPAQDLCSTLAATMAGNAPAVGTGTWTFVSGPGGVVFTPNANTANATATVTVYGTYVFKWTIDNGGVCSTNQNVTINYNPAGQVDQPGNQILCNGASTTAINFTTTNVIGTTAYTWTNSSPGIGLVASGSGNIASFTALNAGTAPVIATIIVTPTLTNGAAICIGSNKTFTITVNPTPKLSTTLTPADLCSNTAFSYPPASATAGTTFNWTRATIAGITPVGPTSGINNPNETLRNITSLPIAVTYQYTLAANGCSNVQNVVVNIKPEPVITAGQAPSACSGNALNYTILLNNFTNPADNVTFTWPAPVLAPVDPLFTGGSARGVPSSSDIPDVFINTTGLLGTATYTVTPFKNGCSGAPVTVVVTVGSQPVLDPGLNAFACSSTPIGLLLKVAAGSVTPSYYNIISKTVQPGLTDVGNAVVPNGTAPDNYLSADKYVNTTGVNKTVTYRIQPILAPSCIGAPVDVVITVRPPILGGALTGSTSICYNTDAPNILNAVLASGGDGVITYSWYYTETMTAVPGDASWTLIGGATLSSYNPGVLVNPTKYVRKAADGSCAAVAYSNMITITVNPLPVTSAIEGPILLCKGAANKVYEVTNTPGSTYTWTLPASMTLNSPQGLYFIIVDATTASLPGDKISVVETFTSTTGCVGLPVDLPITIEPTIPGAVVAGPLQVCQGDAGVVYSVPFNAGSIYSWIVPAGASISTDPTLHQISVTFNMAITGSVSVVETSIALCTTIHVPITVTVNPLPNVYDVTAAAAYCAGDPGVTVSLSNSQTGVNYQLYNSLGTDGAPLPGNTGSALTWINKTAEAYHVVATNVATTCTTPMNGTAVVTINFVASGTIGSAQTICEGDIPATFTNIASGTGGGSISYQWQNSTDNITYNNIVGAAAAIYTSPALFADMWFRRIAISTLGPSVCNATSAAIKVTVNNFVPGSILTDQTICDGAVPLAFTSVTPSGDGGVYTYLWKQSTDGITFTNIAGGTSETYSPPALTQDNWYKRVVTSTLSGKDCVKETNTIKVTVINFVPGSISADQTICEATAPAAFTSVAPTGDGAFTYQWQDSPDGVTFTNIGGATSETFTGPVLATDTWYRRVVTSTLNGVPCIKITNIVKVTVNNLTTGSISADQTICDGGTPAAFTSGTPTGDGALTYKWQNSLDGVSFSDITGAISETYSPGILNADTWYKRLVTSTLNGVSCTKASNTIKVTVVNFIPGSILASQTICEGTAPVAFTSVAPTGDGAFTYQWQNSPDGTTFTNIGGAILATYAPGILAADTWYKRIVTSTLNGVPCVNETNVIKVTVNNFVPGSIGTNQTICEGTAPASFSSVSPTGDGTFTYQWRSSTDNITYSDIIGAVGETYGAGMLAQDTWFKRVVTSTLGANICIKETNIIKVTVINFVAGSIIGDQTICDGGTPVAFTSVTPTGDGAFTYQWKNSTDGVVFNDIAGGTLETYAPGVLNQDTWYKRVVTSTLLGTPCIKETNIVRVTVINFVEGGILADQTICEATAPAPFISVAPTGDGVFSYQWQDSPDGVTFTNIGGATSATFTGPVLAADTWYRRVVTSTLNAVPCVKITNVLKVTVNNFVPGTILADQTICEGSVPAAFTSVTPTGDGTFTYQWQSSLDGVSFVNITGATTETYASGALIADTWFRRQVTSTLLGVPCMKATNTIKVTVVNFLPGSILASQTICEGTAPVAFTSVAPTGDGAFTYQWQNSPDGTTFTNIGGATLATYAPGVLIADTWYKRVVTSTLNAVPCIKETNIIKVTVNNFVAGSIGANQTICDGSAPAPFSSVSPTGDGTFTYQWKSSIDNITYSDIIGAVGETYNAGILTQDTWYKRVVTSTLSGNACTLETNIIKVTVVNFVAGSIIGDQTICDGGTPVAFTSITPTGDGAFTYQWKNSTDGVVFNNIAGATLETYAPGVLTQDTWYKRVVTSTLLGTPCVKETNIVRVTVINFTPGAISMDQTICDGTAPAAFTSVAPTGDGAFTFQWQDSPDGVTFTNILGAVSTTYTAPVLAADTWYQRVVTATLNGVSCTQITNILRVTVINFVQGSITANQTICEGSTPAAFASVAPSGDGVFIFQWQSSIDGVVFSNITGATLNTYAAGPLVQDTWYRLSVISTLNAVQCAQMTNVVKVTVNNFIPGSISAAQTICEGTAPAGLTSVAASGDGVITYQWQNSPDGTTFTNIVGATLPTYAPGILVADTWYKRVVTSTLLGLPCVNETNIVRITVNNFIPGSITGDQTICESSVPSGFTSVTPTGDGSFSYQWQSSANGVLFTDILGAVSETYNSGPLVVDTWFQRTVTSTLLGVPCVSKTNIIKVTVNNLTAGSISGDQTVCESVVPVAFTSVAPTADGIITYQWRSSADGLNFTDIPGATAVTYGAAALLQDTWYKRVVTSILFGVSCSKETNIVKVTVNNVTGGTVISDQTICNGSDPVTFISIANGTGDGVVTFQWQVSTDGVIFADIAGANAPNYDAAALIADRWYKRITKSMLNAVECTKESNVVKVTINQVTGGIIATAQTICNGSVPVALTSTDDGTASGTATYQWQQSNDNVVFNNIPGATTFGYAPGALISDKYYKRIIISILNGIVCTAESNTIRITINPLPVAILTGGATICPAGSTNLVVTMPVGTGPFDVDIENYPGLTVLGYVSGANIPVSPAVTTTYKLLRVRDANGCQVIDPSGNLNGTPTVVVSIPPTITTFTPSPAVCEFTPATFSVTAGGTNPTYQWYVDQGAGFIPVVDGGTYFGATTNTLQIFSSVRSMNGYVYHVIVSGCSTSVPSADAVFTVNMAPEFTLHPADASACLGSNFTFAADATGTSIAWLWEVNKGAGFVPVIPDANFSGETTNTLTITSALPGFNNWIFRARATGICGVPVYSSFARLTVINAPVAGLQPTAKVICENGSTSFIGNGTGYLSLQWQVFSGGSWSDISEDAIYSGTATNQLTISNAPVTLNGNQYRLDLVGACAIIPTTGALLTVNPNPVVSFPAPVNACGNVPIVLNGNPTGGTTPYAQHRWTGDVGPLDSYTTQTPTFNSGIAATYNLNYAVVDSKGCTANGDLQVIVDSPSAIYTKTPNDGCTPLTVSFTKDMTGIASFSWDFGDGSPAETAEANPSHTFTNTNPSTIGYYNVTLTVHSPGGCIETYTSIVTVYPAIDPSFTADKNTVCSNSPIVFTSLPGASKYFWDFGDGVSGYFTNTINHVYTNNTTAPVSQTITLTTTSFYNCTAVKTMNITVMPVPIAQFTASPVSQYFNDAGNPVTFTNTTNPGTWTWLWRFGDGSTSNTQNPTHTYTSLGTFDVVLNVSNETCSDSIERQVSVTPLPPVAAFDPILSGCTPLTIDLNNTSANTNTPGTTYLWDFGDGGGSTSKNPSYTYFTSGIFRVELTVTGPGGTSSVSQIVSSYASPKANFDLSPALVFVNDEKVKFFNLTQGADSYLWDFGDGDTSKVKEPFHKYMAEGVYDVTLWAYLNNMVNGVNVVCSDKYVMSPGVTVEPAGTLRFSTVFTPNKDGEITIDHLPTGTQMDQFFFPAINEKVIKYKLQIFNRLGVLIFESNDINTPWNGYYHGTLCAQGVYVWYVEGKYANGMPFKKVGDVTLLH